jgi:ribosome-binding ATPase YchF (GTP1/OBG family)
VLQKEKDWETSSLMTSGEYDVSRDVEFLEDELNKWFYNLLMKVWKNFSRRAESGKEKFSEAVAKQFSGLKVKEEHVKDVLRELNLPEKPTMWNDREVFEFASELRKKSKPMIIAANKIDKEKGFENYEKLKKKFSDLIIPCSADSELALREAAKAGLIEYVPGEKDFKILDENKINEKQKNALEKIRKEVLKKFEHGTGVQEVLNRAVFEILEYVAVFPASANKLADSKGNILPDCFLLPKGSTALDFAYHLHQDFGNNFIKAIDARTKQARGKDYELKHRDALEIVTR